MSRGDLISCIMCFRAMAYCHFGHWTQKEKHEYLSKPQCYLLVFPCIYISHIFVQIFLENSAGKPIPNENVTIFVGNNKNFTYTTGADGTADFSIDTKPLPASSINLRVRNSSQKKDVSILLNRSYFKTDNLKIFFFCLSFIGLTQAVYKTLEYCYSHSTLFPVYEESQQRVKHFYSRTQSYIKIQPIYRTLTCDNDEKFTVFYALTPEGVGNIPSVVFHHLVGIHPSIAMSYLETFF